MNPTRIRAFASFSSLLLLAAACGAGQSVKESDLAPKTESTKIFAADGTLITTLRQEENREVIPIDRIPKHVRDAVVAIEDERFYTHRGVDLKAILRAIYKNTSEGKVAEGGSTITQQLVRNAISEVGKEKSVERKLKEASYAYNVDKDYSKDKILELYLNTVYFGEGSYGVQTAAQTFYGKDVSDLTLAEGALLAGMVKSPVNYDPRINAEQALRRRNLVLDRMFLNSFAGAEEVAIAKGAELGLRPKLETQKYDAPYFVDYVTRLIQRSGDFEKLGETEQDRGDTLFRKGLRIYTTLDLGMQKAAEEAIAKVLDRPDSDPSATLVAVDPKDGHIKALVGGHDYFATQESDACVKLGAKNADGSPKTCGKVNLALGQGGGGSGRQSGSAFKPFVLAAGLNKGLRLTDAYTAPACINIPNADGGGTRPWHVCNYEEQGSGTVTVREGTYRSINTVYAQMIVDIGGRVSAKSNRQADLGAKEVVKVATEMGICETTTPLLPKGKECELKAVPSAALGSNAVSALDMASAFTAFPNLGVRPKPIAITRITDARDNVLWSAVEDKKQVLNPGVAYLATDAMQDVINRGTGSRNGRIGRPAFGKTGTAQEWRDAWFVGGAGTDLVAAVSVFWPDGEIEMKPSCSGRRTEYVLEQTSDGTTIVKPPECRPTRIRVAGGTWPTQIWQLFMLKALESIPASTFPVPEVDVVKVKVDSTRGCLPNPYTPPNLIKSQSFIKGTQPTEICAEPSGPVAATVPNVVGFPQEEGVKLLENAGFVVTVKTEASSLYPPGRITRQSPSGGTDGQAGQTVTVWVARAAASVPVPDVVGMTEADAKQALEDAGFKVLVDREPPCGGKSSDCRVTSQSPAGGTNAPENSDVQIVIRPT